MAERYCTKKKGATEVYPFRSMEDILNMMNYFKDREQWDNYLIFMYGLLLGRRISDTISMKWDDLIYENGNYKNEINTIEELKTGKTTVIPVSPMVKQVTELYLEKTGRKVTDNIHDWIFQFDQKTEWKNREGSRFYTNENNYDSEMDMISAWCDLLNKDFSDRRKTEIENEFHKQKEFSKLGEYLYYDVEWHFVIKAQIEIFRREFVKAAKEVGITYNVSTHTLRKSFGMWTKKLHPYDADCLTMLQNIFNHSDVQTTTRYIGLTAEKKIQYFNDMGDFLSNIENGKMDDIQRNSPVVSLKSDDLREVLKEAIAETEEDSLTKFNRIMNMVDQLRIQSL